MIQNQETTIEQIQASIPAMFAETINELESKKTALRNLIQNSAGTSDAADRASMLEEQAKLESDINRISSRLKRFNNALSRMKCTAIALPAANQSSYVECYLNQLQRIAPSVREKRNTAPRQQAMRTNKPYGGLKLKVKTIAKASLLPMLIASLLGCDSESKTGNTSDTNTGSNPKTVQYTAIDGYLANAAVYADRNEDSTPSEDEYLGLTDANGNIDVSYEDTNYAIIVKILPGVTTDSDVSGALTESKELIAEPGILTITPYTTLAYTSGLDIEELAVQLNVDASKISGDYIAAGNTDSHIVARSLYQTFEGSIIGELSEYDQRLNEAKELLSYTEANAESEWDGMILIVDENNNVTLTPIEELNKTQFDWTKADVQWEQKQFEDHSDVYGDAFHPCYANKWTNEIVLVSNCRGNYFISIDVASGDILNSLNLAPYTSSEWFFDKTALTVITEAGTTDYDTDFKALTNYSSEALVRVSGDQRNIHFEDGTNELLIEQLDDSALYYTDTLMAAWAADGVAFRSYDSDTGDLFEVKPDGTMSETTYDDAATIMGEVAPYHNGLSANNIIPIEAPSAVDENMSVLYLSNDTFLVRVDTDAKYVSNDYHYFYRDGKITYLGQFNEGDWYKGLDNSTLSYYSSMRTYSDSSYSVFAEPHLFKQFDIESGELVNEWEKSHEDFAPVLYRQVHTDLGIISVSDTYSSVSLIK